jgi:hypothetical protein
MIMRIILFSSLLYLISLFILFPSCKSNHAIYLTLENDLEISRVDEPIIISRGELEKRTDQISQGLLPVLIDKDGNHIPSQLDDMSGDGNWDEMFLLISIPAKSNSELRVNFVLPENYPVYETRTNVRFAIVESDGSYVPQTLGTRLGPDDKPAIEMFHHEGPAWENDRVGFRNYFNHRNSMDIFGKTTTEMILDRAGIDEDYHYMQDWGMDILMVGNSLGAGGLALGIGEEIHRVAPGAPGTYELVSQGPLRSIIRLGFNNWMIGNHEYSLTHDIALWGGALFYESTVSLSGVQGDETLITGIATISLDEILPMEIGSTHGITTVATHGLQAYKEGEYLGMAVMVVDGNYLGYGHMDADGDDIQHSLLVKMKASESSPVRFRFYSAWEHTDGKFESREYFKQFIETDVRALDSPIRVSVK